MPLYFAYGSNLDPAQLAEREVTFHRPRHAFAHGWKLVFNKVATINAAPDEGRANIVPVPGAVVEGVGFDVDEAGLANLDWYEGARSGHYRRTTIEIAFDERTRATAVTYVAQFTATGLRPSGWYRDRIVRGARHFGLSAEYIARLERWPIVEHPTSERMR